MGETFVLPVAKVHKNNKLIPGTDGEKMSKSKNNVIDIFLDDKSLRKQIMSIKTDSTSLESPKKWSTCNCFAIYKLLADKNQIQKMKNNYINGNYGYGHAKQELYELIINKFSNERSIYSYYISNPQEIYKILSMGAEKASAIADEVLSRVRSKIGY